MKRARSILVVIMISLATIASSCMFPGPQHRPHGAPKPPHHNNGNHGNNGHQDNNHRK